MTKPTHVYIEEPAFTIDPAVGGLVITDVCKHRNDIEIVATVQLSAGTIAVIRALLAIAEAKP